MHALFHTPSNTHTPNTPQGFASLYDPILAYEFAYPTQTASGSALSMVLSHPPEKVLASGLQGCAMLPPALMIPTPTTQPTTQNPPINTNSTRARRR
jgi:hypothetical protein